MHGMGMICVHPQRQVRELLLPLVADAETSMEVGGAAALALGLVFISSQDEDAVGAALQVCWGGARFRLRKALGTFAHDLQKPAYARAQGGSASYGLAAQLAVCSECAGAIGTLVARVPLLCNIHHGDGAQGIACTPAYESS